MYKISNFVLIGILALSSLNVCFGKEPANLDIYKHKLIKYHDSGEYQIDQAKAIHQAMEYLSLRIANEKASHHPKKLAIVLDIDETSLSNYLDMLNMSFGGTKKAIEESEGNGTDPVIQPTLDLYRYAKANNVAVFFITGRTEPYRAATEKNLTQAGYANWDGLILKPENYHEKTAAIYKTHAREELEKQGYTIVLNIGDQKSDLKGKHADKVIKLPNPYYIIP